MNKESRNKLGKTLLGTGGASVFLAFLFCGFSWTLVGLFAVFGLGFLLQDQILISITVFGVIIAFVGWRMLKK